MHGQQNNKFFCIYRRILIPYSRRNWTGTRVSVIMTNNLMNAFTGDHSYFTNRHALRNATTDFNWN